MQNPHRPSNRRPACQRRKEAIPEGQLICVLAPIVLGRKGSHRELLAKARKDDYTEAWIDGKRQVLESGLKLDRYLEHEIDLLIGEIPAKGSVLNSVLHKALDVGSGAARIVGSTQQMLLSSKRACPRCGQGYPELDPRFFSFNTRQGQCPTCEGRAEIITKKWRGHRRKTQPAGPPLSRLRPNATFPASARSHCKGHADYSLVQPECVRSKENPRHTSSWRARTPHRQSAASRNIVPSRFS